MFKFNFENLASISPSTERNFKLFLRKLIRQWFPDPFTLKQRSLIESPGTDLVFLSGFTSVRLGFGTQKLEPQCKNYFQPFTYEMKI